MPSESRCCHSVTRRTRTAPVAIASRQDKVLRVTSLPDVHVSRRCSSIVAHKLPKLMTSLQLATLARYGQLSPAGIVSRVIGMEPLV